MVYSVQGLVIVFVGFSVLEMMWFISELFQMIWLCSQVMKVGGYCQVIVRLVMSLCKVLLLCEISLQGSSVSLVVGWYSQWLCSSMSSWVVNVDGVVVLCVSRVGLLVFVKVQLLLLVLEMMICIGFCMCLCMVVQLVCVCRVL